MRSRVLTRLVPIFGLLILVAAAMGAEAVPVFKGVSGPGALQPSPLPSASAPAQPVSAITVFQAASPLVFAIRTAQAADTQKSSYGTGFVIRRTGLLATNYHVVSD